MVKKVGFSFKLLNLIVTPFLCMAYTKFEFKTQEWKKWVYIKGTLKQTSFCPTLFPRISSLFFSSPIYTLIWNEPNHRRQLRKTNRMLLSIGSSNYHLFTYSCYLIARVLILGTKLTRIRNVRLKHCSIDFRN